MRRVRPKPRPLARQNSSEDARSSMSRPQTLDFEVASHKNRALTSEACPTRAAFPFPRLVLPTSLQVGREPAMQLTPQWRTVSVYRGTGRVGQYATRNERLIPSFFCERHFRFLSLLLEKFSLNANEDSRRTAKKWRGFSRRVARHGNCESAIALSISSSWPF